MLAATNRPDLIDPALLRPGRFDLVIALPEPDRDTRLAILEVHCARSPLDRDVDLSALADATEGMTGADIAALCQRARMSAIAGSVASGPGQDFKPFAVEARHFRSALEAVTSIRAAIAYRRLADAA